MQEQNDTFAQQPKTMFQQVERAPLAEQAQLQCFKCNRPGHASNQCPNFQIPGPATTSTSNQQHRGGNKRIRINATTGELPTVLFGPVGQPKGTFLVDLGAGINLLKRKWISRTEPIPVTKFAMGHSEFESSERVIINLFGKKLDFHVVDNDFPLIEDGILGLPALQQFKFELSNDELKLDNNIILLQRGMTILSEQTISKTVYLEEKETSVCLAYNTMIHDSTGYTPVELTFRHEANLPSTISQNPQRTYTDEVASRKRKWDSTHSEAHDQLIKSKKRYQRDQRRQSIFKNEGDRVLIHNDHKEYKLDIEWLGPYTIEKIKTPYYEILVQDNIEKVNGTV